MKIVVLVKVVPEKIVFDSESLRIKRIGESLFNPLDIIALREAIKIKRSNQNVSITVISMAPQKEREILQKLFNYEVDRVIHLSDLAFAGSDVYATAFILAKAIKTFQGDYNLILAGNYSPDGLTGQLGGELASLLSIPFLTSVKELTVQEPSLLTIKKIASQKTIETFTVKSPTLLTFDASTNTGVSPNLYSILHSKEKEVETLDTKNLKLPEDFSGSKFSKTFVKRVFNIEANKQRESIRENWLDAFNDFIKNSGVAI